MTQIRVLWLALIAVVAAVLGWGASLLAALNSVQAPVLHLTSLITVGAATGIVLILGLRVRAVQAQRRRWLEQRRAADSPARSKRAGESRGPGAERRRPAPVEISPLLAARTLLLAQAIAYAGAMLLGWHAGVLVDLLGAASGSSPTVVTAWVMLAAGLVMVVVGWVVEHFCKLPPDDAARGMGNTDERGEGFPAGA